MREGVTPEETTCGRPTTSLLLQLRSIVEPLNLTDLFPAPQPLEVELGSGDGSFLNRVAEQYRERNFVGVERLLGRIRKIDRRGRRMGLTNLRLVRIEAAYFMKYLLPPASVTVLHVYFPDPWPKRRHQKNRLINGEFVAIAAKALKSGGEIFCRTDDADYHTQIMEVFADAGEFQSMDTPAARRSLKTDFERDFEAQGIMTRYAAFRKKLP